MMMSIFFFFVALFSCPTAYAAVSSHYKKYDYYPPYCSTEDEMAKRAIPPLVSNNDATRLVHVTSIIRHGARTPYQKDDCWKGYAESRSTSVWDCDLTTIVGPTMTRKDEQQLEQDQDHTHIHNHHQPLFLFEKKYDALISLVSKDNGVENFLQGTCQVGQLLLQGYDQEYSNGRHLRNAYAFHDKNDENRTSIVDYRMNLIPLSEIHNNRMNDTIVWDSLIRYRSDDEERTVMSGQVFLSGIFGNDKENDSQNNNNKSPPNIIIPFHTADYDRDIIRANPNVCPRLNDLQHQAETSKEYDAMFRTSERISELRTLMRDKLEWDLDVGVPFDCLMTTVCTDRPLPPILRPDQNSSSIYHEIAQYSMQKIMFKSLYNNAEYSKLAMRPLWREIFTNMNPFINIPTTTTTAQPPKLAHFSVHDTTIIQLMATLGDRVWNLTDWPPYASMMIIEIHEILHAHSSSDNDENVTNNFAFRLVYNGNVMTPLVNGCPNTVELCDIVVLKGLIDPLLEGPWECDSLSPSHDDDKSSCNTTIGTTIGGGVWSMVVLAIVSAAVGSFATITVLTKTKKSSTESSSSSSTPILYGSVQT